MSKRININKATRDELISLKGVGGAMADRIIAHRTRINGFDSVDDLEHVPGVSERLLRELRRFIAASDDEPVEESGASITVTLDPGEEHGEYSGYSVNVSGTRFIDEQPVPFVVSEPVLPEGKAVIAIPERDTLSGDVRIDVTAPDGLRAARKEFPGSKLPKTLEIDVPPGKTAETQPNQDPKAGKPSRIRGRVIDEGGWKVPADLQVVLWAATVNNPQDADYKALVVTHTDSQGHFTGPYPLGKYSSAHGAVAIAGDPQDITIHLDNGEFPDSVILVVDLSTHQLLEKECDCAETAKLEPPRAPDSTDLARADGTYSSDPGAGRCVDFTKPDRTLEEFTFSYAVRTTEPRIKGFTLEEPPKFNLGHLKELVSVVPLQRTMASAEPSGAPSAAARSRTAAEAVRHRAAAAIDSEQVSDLEGVRVDARLLKTLARDPDGFSLTTLLKSAQRTSHIDLQRALGHIIAKRPSRERLSCSNRIDWDHEPTIYQACTIAHGHLLRFKQEWVADGYSMGNLLYSLPLAPGQKKRISVVDWERRESAARREELLETEALDALLQRDRDISDVVRGAVYESTRGGSKSSSGAVAGGIGIGAILGPVGGLLGIGGGHSSASNSPAMAS